MTDIPFYQRTLDSFADEIIVRVLPQGAGTINPTLWTAVLDVGPVSWPSDPDFVTSGKSRAEAISLCANKIRNDAKGIGKFAPHSILTDGYDLHFRLMKHWQQREGAST